MPPTRAAKKNTSTAKYGRLSAYGFKKLDRDEADAQAQARRDREESEAARESSLSPVPAPLPEKKKLPKPVAKGDKVASFSSDGNWNDNYRRLVGTSTKKIVFGRRFVLNDSHINDILSLGSRVSNSLTDITFEYSDVSYDAHNDAKALTDPTMTRLASACPNLKKVELRATERLTDTSLMAFFQFCPKLTHLEITAASGHSLALTGTAFTTLLENPEWVPKLKKLRVAHSSTKGFMKAMRELTKERETLTVELVQVSESKNWGDWDLEVSHETYKKGRKAPNSRRRGGGGYGGYGFDDDREYNNYRMTGEISEAYLAAHGYY